MNNLVSFFIKYSLAFSFAKKALVQNKRRTALSLIGVIIGVFAIFVVLALGNGVRQFVVAQVETFGTDLLQVEVKVPRAGKLSNENAAARSQGVQITTLTTEDADAIAKLPNILAVYGGTIGQERATYKEVGKRILLFGTGADALVVDTNARLSAGRFFGDEEDESEARVVVLGSKVVTSFFGKNNSLEVEPNSVLGEKVTIKGERYRIIGVLESRGSAGFFDLDTMVYTPIQTLQKRILGVDYIQFVSVRMQNRNLEKETSGDITALLRNRHDIDNPDKDDFGVTSTEEAKATLDTVLSALTGLLLGLTTISLIVGGVGVMNVLYVAVAERTSEIGLRKAVGATGEMVLLQFLAEALLVTLLGGIIGIFLGAGVVQAAVLLFAKFGYVISGVFTLSTFLISLFFAFLVGMVFGFAPAERASELLPIEALRRE
jgi:putative ABC transport system permease protein